MSFVAQSLLVLLSFGAVYFWQKTDLAVYTIPVIGFLIFLYLLVSIKNKNRIDLGGPLTFFVLNTVVLLFIFETGGLSSNLFFLLYFILFGAAFVLEAKLVYIFAAGAIIVFLPEVFKNDVLANLLKVGSLILISPLAYFFGKQFGNEKEIKERAKDAADTISEDIDDLLENNEHLNSKDVEKLNEVLEETEDLRSEVKEK